MMTYILRYFVTAEDHVTGGEASGDRSETGQALRLFHSLQQIPATEITSLHMYRWS